ncbi:uncharacterized protein LOC120175480 [Hibiscus syriacus]|uniref:uncharacterized protein LOC120175480 n=1 Tax=Hibiscus syriacus TaxID=106335 RepID=UPI0019221347|nr:uncharacterized protein LOC120175480 [Hibiscus syriacus]
MIAPNQSAFVRGRKIEDNTLLAQEIVRGYGRGSISPRCVIKADLQKAFDSLNWKFLLAVLKEVEEVSGRGDPLSPYLFVMAINVLSKLLDVAAFENFFQYHPKYKRVNLTHLCFADDLLIFCKGNVDSIIGVSCVLEKFYEMSGLRLNASKTEIFIAGANDDMRTLVHEVTGFKLGCLPVRYLGVPLVPRKLTEKDCVSLVEKIKLTCWNKACMLLLVKELLMAEMSLWVAWVRFYVFKGVDLCSVESKPSFNWSIRKILKVREEVRPLFSGIADWGKVNAHWLWQEIRGMTVKVEWHKVVWFPMHILKHSLIAWMAILNILPTADRLIRKLLGG